MHALISYFFLFIFLNITTSVHSTTATPAYPVLECQNQKDTQTIMQELLSLLPTGTEICAPLYASVRLYLSTLFSDQINNSETPIRSHKTKEESAAQCAAISNYLLNKSFSIPEHDLEQLYKSIALYEFENLRTPFHIKPRTEKSDLEKRDEQILTCLKYAAVAAIVYLGTQAVYQEKLNAANIQIAAERQAKTTAEEQLTANKTEAERQIKEQREAFDRRQEAFDRRQIEIDRQFKELQESSGRRITESLAAIERLITGQQRPGTTVFSTSNGDHATELAELREQFRKLEQEKLQQVKEKFQTDLRNLNEQIEHAKTITGTTEKELEELKRFYNLLLKDFATALTHGNKEQRDKLKSRWRNELGAQPATAQTGTSASDFLNTAAGVIGGLVSVVGKLVTS